jgi:hypothetical protein
MRPVLLAVLAVGGLVGVAACSSSTPANPQITFSTSDTTVSADPIQYCDEQEQHCSGDGKAPVQVTVGTGVQVHVRAPESVSSTPWQVAARFHGTKSGDDYASCSPLFAAGKQTQYTVTPPAGDELVLIEVYQSSAVLNKNPDGVFSTPVRGTWVLTNKTRTGTVLPQPGDNLCDD